MPHYVEKGFDSSVGHTNVSDMSQDELNKAMNELNLTPSNFKLTPSNNLGVSETNMASVGGGALGGLDFQGAMDLLKQVTPESKPIDKNMLGLLYFTDLARRASEPGATLFGSAAGALESPTAYLVKRREEERKRKAAMPAQALTLATALSKTTGFKNYEVIPPTGSGEKYTKFMGIQEAKNLQNQGFILNEVSKDGKETFPKKVEILDATEFKLKFPGINLPQNNIIDLTADEVSKLKAGSFTMVVDKKPNTYEDEFGDQRFLDGPNAGQLVTEVLTAKKVENQDTLETDIINEDGGADSQIPELKKLNKVQWTNAKNFREEISKGLKDFKGIQASYNKIKKFYENRSEISDYSLAVGYAKIIDPGTAAREGEVAAIANSGALSQAIKTQLINAIIGGGKLPERVRAGIYNNSARIFNEERVKAIKFVDTYKDLWESQVGPGQEKWINVLTIDDEFTDFVELPDPLEGDGDIVLNETVLMQMTIPQIEKIINETLLDPDEITLIRKVLNYKKSNP